MERAIAVGRRTCQAEARRKVLVARRLLLVPAMIVLCGAVHCRAQAAPALSRSAGRQAAADRRSTVSVEESGITIKEICLPGASTNPAPSASGQRDTQNAPCGTLARRTADIARRFTVLLGPCPRKVLTILPETSHSGVAASPFAPGIIEVSEEVARFADFPALSPSLVPREMARQWFPSAAASARLYNAELVEILAEYLAWRYLLETDPEAARVIVAEAMRDVAARANPQPIFALLDRSGGRQASDIVLVRRPGLLVLRTLETVIDRERVDRVLPEFMRRYGSRPATIGDFRAVCEEIAGRKLGWFFDYFIQGTQNPVIELRRVPSESPGIVAGEIVVRDFPAEGSVRVEMSVRTAQGTVEHSVATRGAVTPFTVNVPAPALGITLDPDLRILRWTEAARRSKEQSALLAALPDPITAKNLPAAIELYRRALAADPDDAARRAQALHERLGELEWAHDEWNAALADLDPAINGHSISPFETYLCRAKGYLYHGVVQLHERRPAEAQKDARAGLALPRAVLLQLVPREPIESRGDWNLERLLETLSDAASRY